MVPIGVLLERPRGLNRGDVVARAGHEPKSNRQILFGETAGNGKRRQPAKVADGTQRIRKGQVGFQIERERGGGNRLRGSHQHVEAFKNGVHFFLEDFARSLSFPERISERKEAADSSCTMREAASSHGPTGKEKSFMPLKIFFKADFAAATGLALPPSKDFQAL